MVVIMLLLLLFCIHVIIPSPDHCHSTFSNIQLSNPNCSAWFWFWFVCYLFAGSGSLLVGRVLRIMGFCGVCVIFAGFGVIMLVGYTPYTADPTDRTPGNRQFPITRRDIVIPDSRFAIARWLCIYVIAVAHSSQA